ncbi:hypothetical protein BJX68DRAFT_40687 [Aspergillus pseudodeflectus]|uniref:NmrA-like domain-containing protein n=1 Tax=Aspergillus pseudodeflectus TaxID=176178 RepID=A0ABR4KPJ2_9EURO
MSSPSKLVVFGATGQQGSSILTTVLSHPELSKKYSLRGITRNASGPKAIALAEKGIEIVEANLDDPSSLPRAVENAHTVVLITETRYEKDLKEGEFRQAKAVADAAVAAGVEFIIFSTSVHCARLWDNGPVDQFDVKAEIEEYIRGLPLKSAFIAPGMFMSNFTTIMVPRRQDDGSYLVVGVNDPETKIPLVETAVDTGLYAVPLLKDPEGMNGKVMYAATKLYTFNEIVEVISRVSGEMVRYQALPKEVFVGFMKEEMGARMVAMMSFIDEPGYYGPGTAEKVRETVGLVEGKLTTFEEFAGRYLTDLEAIGGGH